MKSWLLYFGDFLYINLYFLENSAGIYFNPKGVKQFVWKNILFYFKDIDLRYT